jgi:ATP-dependent exoDNAse (exonuclease V) beta subunit
MQAPDLAKTRFVEDLHKELTSKYVLAKTELLVYSLELRMAGQVDLLMREDSTEYHILDYKFIKEPLEKSYYNRFTRKYKMMGRSLVDGHKLLSSLQHSLRYTGT